jgi:hypothetical protein
LLELSLGLLLGCALGAGLDSSALPLAKSLFFNVFTHRWSALVAGDEIGAPTSPPTTTGYKVIFVEVIRI